MDPLSIVATSAALATFAFKASSAIYSGFDAAKTVDSTISLLRSEITALGTSLENIATTFQSSEVINFCATTSDSSKLLRTVKPIMDDCEKTFDVLGLLLESVQGNPKKSNPLLRKPKAALKLHFKEREIELLRQQIRSCSGAMQLTLQMVGICVAVNGNNRMDVLGSKLSGLSAQIAGMEQKLSNTTKKIPEIYMVSNHELEMQKHIQQQIRVAEMLFSNASVYAESVSGKIVGYPADFGDSFEMFGSVMGKDEEQRPLITRWTPGEATLQENQTFTNDDHGGFDWDKQVLRSRLGLAQDKLAAGEFATATVQLEACLADLTSIEILYPYYDAYDLKLEILRTQINMAHSILNFGDFTIAATTFETCLGKITSIENFPPHEIYDIIVALATAYADAKDHEKQISTLLGSLNQELSEVHTLHLKHLISVCYLNQYVCYYEGRDVEKYGSAAASPSFSLSISRSYAEEALKGRRRLLGTRHESCFETIYLLVLILKSQGERNSGEVYEKLLPPEYENHLESNSMLFPGTLPTLYLIHAGIGWWDAYQARIWALETGNLVVLRFKFPASTYETRQLFCHTCLAGNLRDVQLLLGAGANVNFTNEFLQTPLLSAMEGGHLDIIQVLIQQGANVNQFGWAEKCPLDVAVSYRNIPMIQLLLENGAGDTHGKRNTLEFAFYYGRYQILRFLNAKVAAIGRVFGWVGVALFFYTYVGPMWRAICEQFLIRG